MLGTFLRIDPQRWDYWIREYEHQKKRMVKLGFGPSLKP